MLFQIIPESAYGASNKEVGVFNCSQLNGIGFTSDTNSSGDLEHWFLSVRTGSKSLCNDLPLTAVQDIANIGQKSGFGNLLNFGCYKTLGQQIEVTLTSDASAGAETVGIYAKYDVPMNCPNFAYTRFNDLSFTENNMVSLSYHTRDTASLQASSETITTTFGNKSENLGFNLVVANGYNSNSLRTMIVKSTKPTKYSVSLTGYETSGDFLLATTVI